MTMEPAPGPAHIDPAHIDPAHIDPAQIDYSALTQPVTRDQVKAFRNETRAARRANPNIHTGFTTAASTASIIAFAVFGIFFLVVLVNIATIGGSGASIGSVIGLLVFVLVMLLVAFFIYSAIFGLGGAWLKWMRLSQFGAANGLQYVSESDDLDFAGCIFQVGYSKAAYDYFMTTSGRSVDFGNYRYTTGSGKNRTTHSWGFLALQLDRRLPNMVLDSKSNNGLFGGTNLPQAFSRDQVLSLEGDFDKYFTLYCPREYEQDALYVFTPDLMALLIDDAAPFDVEIVDDWMFVYSAHPFEATSPATYQRLFRIVATVGAKAVTQTERYHDDRVASPGANIVAPQGQRLRHGVSLTTIVIGAIIAGIWLYSVLTGQ
jgi:predicted secreted protein